MDGNWWFKSSSVAVLLLLSVIYLVWTFGGWSTSSELQGYYARLAQLEALVVGAPNADARQAAERTLRDHESKEAVGSWDFEVGSDDAGSTVASFLANQVDDLTVSRVEALAAAGKATVDGAVATGSKTLTAGQKVSLSIDGGGHRDSLTRPPAWAGIFPEKKISLGLDLQGGIDLELQVDLRKALEAAADRGSGQIPDLLEDEGIAATALRVEDTSSIIVLVAGTDAENARRIIRDNSGLYVYLGATDVDGRQELLYALQDWHELNIKQTALQQAVETIRNRVDEFGVTEPVILTKGEDRITVQLPGLDDPQRAIDLVGQTARLEFRMLYGDTHPNAGWSDARVSRVVEEAITEANLAEGYSDAQLAQALKGKIPDDAEVFHNKIFDELQMRHTRNEPYLVNRKVDLTGDRVEYGSVSRDQFNVPYVRMELDDEGARLFSRLSGDNVGKRMAIILDGNVNSAPVFQEKIPNGIASITLGDADSVQAVRNAQDLVVVLHAGALPAPIEILHNRTVGKTLGDDSIRSGRFAALVAAVLVLIFMGLYYRGAGLVANLAVGLNMAFILAVLAAFGATLTLPGIAGIILTIGMAVDANVIIFERIREELRADKSVRAAVASGYEKATWTILDANITTFITGAVLYSYGSGPIKGFAVTLMIGIFTSVFTALVVTRLVFDYFTFGRGSQRLSIGI